MTESSLPPLPSRLPRVGLTRTLVAFGLSLVSIVLSFVTSIVDSTSPEPRPDDALSFLLLLGGIVGIMAGTILAFYSWYHTRRLARTLASKKLLAHWTVSGEHWLRYIANERSRATREVLLFTLFIVGFTLLVVFWSRRPGDTTDPWSWDDAAAVMGVMIGFGVIGWGVTQFRLYLLRRQESGAIYITTDGVLLNRRWHSWWQIGRRLDCVTYERDPDNELIFTYCKPGPNHGETRVTLRVPVPPRCADEARRLVARYRKD
jgi:hypothetical protein